MADSWSLISRSPGAKLWGKMLVTSFCCDTFRASGKGIRGWMRMIQEQSAVSNTSSGNVEAGAILVRSAPYHRYQFKIEEETS